MTARTLPGVREAWIEWLNRVFENETHLGLVTLTFAGRPYESQSTRPGPTRSRVARAARSFAARLTRGLESPSFFGVLEVGGWNGRRHSHFLVSEPEAAVIRQAIAMHEQSEGFASYRIRERSSAAAEYVGKYLLKSNEPDWWAGGGLFEAGVRAGDELLGRGAGADRGGNVIPYFAGGVRESSGGGV